MDNNKVSHNTAVVALRSLLEYAKYLEDNGQLSYELLKARVDTFEESQND